jgi:protein-tyrosine-phosphatase
MTTTILACTDGSSYASSIYKHTAWVADRLSASVEVLHVLDHHRERAARLDMSGSIGIDASDHVARKLDSEALDWADVAVSTCSEEVCPVTPGARRLNWHLPDPKGLPLEQVRPIRDEIRRLVSELVDELDQATTAPA